MAIARSAYVWILLTGTFSGLYCQIPGPTESAGKSSSSTQQPAYLLRSNDSLVIQALEIEEINGKAVRIDPSGDINLPMIGRVHAEGLTTEQCEAVLIDKLKTYFKRPQISVTITEFSSQPVSIIGAVVAPGLHTIQGKKTLIEMLSLSGGAKDDAGAVVRITRRAKWGAIPLPGAAWDESQRVSTAEVNLKSLIESRNPAENIEVYPEDVISVPRAEIIYVIGEVSKPGGYVLRERSTLSALQAISMAGGVLRAGSTKNARILRRVDAKQERQEIPVDLKKMLIGQAADVPLLPEDILFVPNNVSRSVALRSLEAAITVGTGLALYRNF